MSSEHAIDLISDFVSKAFEGARIGPEQDIFESGFGNSMFAMQMVTFVETTFDIELDGDDLDIDSFRSIARVAELVARKRQETAS
ncbi:MAG: acyl carrier protein [Gammaproteobacteria bacterium]|nr:acyl carrier protein [Gammaproteobacteria bacterium]